MFTTATRTLRANTKLWCPQRICSHIQVYGTHGRQDLANATITSNAEERRTLDKETMRLSTTGKRQKTKTHGDHIGSPLWFKDKEGRLGFSLRAASNPSSWSIHYGIVPT